MINFLSIWILYVNYGKMGAALEGPGFESSQMGFFCGEFPCSPGVCVGILPQSKTCTGLSYLVILNCP